MLQLRLFSVYDSGVHAYLRPFWSDHKANAIRSFIQLVNDTSDANNMIHNHPDQFALFEIGVFDCGTGVFSAHSSPITLGKAIEYVKSSIDSVS